MAFCSVWYQQQIVPMWEGSINMWIIVGRYFLFVVSPFKWTISFSLAEGDQFWLALLYESCCVPICLSHSITPALSAAVYTGGCQSGDWSTDRGPEEKCRCGQLPLPFAAGHHQGRSHSRNTPTHWESSQQDNQWSQPGGLQKEF